MSTKGFAAYKRKLDKARKQLAEQEAWAEDRKNGVIRFNDMERALAVLADKDVLPGLYEDRPSDVHPKNAERAQRARDALDYYAFIGGEDEYTGAMVCAITYDLIGDLMHLLHQEGIVFDEVMKGVRDDRFKRELVDPLYILDDEDQ